MSNKRLTYSKAGVDTNRGDRFVDLIAPIAKTTARSEIENSVGGFAAMAKFPARFKNPRIVVSTDGVGTKVLLAKQMKKYDTVGIDLVAMSVNDILTLGAEPLLFLDYFATSRIELNVGKKLIEGIAEGCKQASCALVGGETAEMPQVYKKGDFDLAGFCVGVVDQDQVITGQSVEVGDRIIGIPSYGVHSNGFSLVRHIVTKKKLSLSLKPRGFKKTLGQALLAPTRIYVREILDLMNFVQPKAMAHITGGGIEGNLPRVLPNGAYAQIDKNTWKVPELFRFLQQKGNVSEHEMFQTFNMGIGFILVISASQQSKVMELIPDAVSIGAIVKGNGEPKVIWKN